MEKVVERVLAVARQRLYEQLTLDDLAKLACFSKFHFARMFRRVTGLSPRRFLYALRMQEAKRLLASTELSVAEVSNQVGYSSVGTFTSRFTASVGVSPAVYRRRGGDIAELVRREPPDPGAPGAIVGQCMAAEATGPVVVGLSRQPLPEGRPIRYDLADRTGGFEFTGVPAGRWHLVAVAWQEGGPTMPDSSPQLMALKGVIKVGADRSPVPVTLTLRPVRTVDPPLLFPFPPLPLTVPASPTEACEVG